MDWYPTSYSRMVIECNFGNPHLHFSISKLLQLLQAQVQLNALYNIDIKNSPDRLYYVRGKREGSIES